MVLKEQHDEQDKINVVVLLQEKNVTILWIPLLHKMCSNFFLKYNW